MAVDLELIMTRLDERLQTVTDLNTTPEVPTQGTPPFAFDRITRRRAITSASR